MDFKGRADQLFAAREKAIGGALDAMMAEHSAAGRLESGATAKAAVHIFESHTSAGLAQALAEMAKQVEHRGRAWDKAADSISASLEDQIARARVILEVPLRHASVNEGTAAGRAVDQLISESGDRLRSQLREFQDGWTAPQAKAWKDRHPYLDRAVFAIFGAIVAIGAAYLAGLFGIKA